MPSGTFKGYYRVTEVLEAYNGLGDIDPKILANAADRGDRVHNFCELYAKDMLFQEVDFDCMTYVESFIEWFDSTVEEVISVEERFFSEDLKITGQVDLLAVLKGDTKPTVIDFKTPASVSKTWNLQLAAYWHLVNQKHDIDRCIALQLPKKGGAAKAVEINDLYNHWNIYKGILDGYRYFNPI